MEKKVITTKIIKDGKEMKVEIRRMGLGVMRALDKWGILGLSQLDGLVFHKGLEQRERLNLFFNSRFQDEYRGASYKVLGRLERWGLVKVNSYANAPKAYTLTMKGHGILLKEHLARLKDFRDSVADSFIKHELMVNGIGLVLSELHGLRVSTEFERHVLSQGALETSSSEEFPLPDLWVTDHEQPKAIEVERTQKSAKRYRKLWSFYRDNLPPNSVVLYVTAFPNGPKLLLKRARKLLMDFIYVCDLDEFQASLGRCPFVSHRGSQIRLETWAAQPHEPHNQRVPMASLSVRPGVSGSIETLPIAPSTSPSRPEAGMLSLTLSRQGQSVSPLPMRPFFPLPHPPTPSPAPEGEQGF